MEELLMRKLSKISKENGVDICLNAHSYDGYLISVTREDQEEKAIINSWHLNEEEIIYKIYELIEELNKKTIMP